MATKRFEEKGMLGLEPGEHYDTVVSGGRFRVRVSASKPKRWKWCAVRRLKDGTQPRKGLGEWLPEKFRGVSGYPPHVALSEARIAAIAYLEGPEPTPKSSSAPSTTTNNKEPTTFAELVTEYGKRREEDAYGWKSTQGHMGLFANHVTPRWGTRPLKGEGKINGEGKIKGLDAKHLLDKIERGEVVIKQRRGPWPKVRGGKGAARQVHDGLSALFKWALRKELVDVNPIAQLEKSEIPPKGKSTRSLSDDEIKLVWQAAFDVGYPGGTVFMMALLTGQRRSEIAEMPWSELPEWLRKGEAMPVDAHPVWILPKERQEASNETEVLEDMEIPLVPLAIKLLRGLQRFACDAVFTCNGTSPIVDMQEVKRKIDQVIMETTGKPLPAWRLHDTRHTVRTGLARCGVSRDTAERVLGHLVGSKVERTYDHYKYFKEKLEALLVWEKHLTALIPPPLLPDFKTESSFQKRSKQKQREQRSFYIANPDKQKEAAALSAMDWSIRAIGRKHGGQSSGAVHRAIKREQGTDRRRTPDNSSRGSILPTRADLEGTPINAS